MRQSGSVAVLKGTVGQSGKEAEKPLGKIFARAAYTETTWSMLHPI
jgi:hypothetical protein